MSDGKKKWATPVLKIIIPSKDLVDRLMATRAEAGSSQEAPQEMTKNVREGHDIVQMEECIAEPTRSLAECGQQLAECQSRLGASGSTPPPAVANANGDYRPPYSEKSRRRQAKTTSEQH